MENLCCINSKVEQEKKAEAASPIKLRNITISYKNSVEKCLNIISKLKRVNMTRSKYGMNCVGAGLNLRLLLKPSKIQSRWMDLWSIAQHHGDIWGHMGTCPHHFLSSYFVFLLVITITAMCLLAIFPKNLPHAKAVRPETLLITSLQMVRTKLLQAEWVDLCTGGPQGTTVSTYND